MRAFGALVTAAALLLGCGASSGTDGIRGQDQAGQANERAVADNVDGANAEPSLSANAAATVEPMPTPTTAATPTSVSTPTSVPTPTAEPSPTPTPSLSPEPTANPNPDDPNPDAPDAGDPDAGDPEADEDEKPDLPPSDYQGEVRALRTQGGVMLTIRGVTADSYLVVTPCYNEGIVTGGLPISGALDVLIDPGHGGDESGAVGPNGLKESTVNLRVAELLRSELLERGFSVELTRYSDHRVAIQSRAELANALSPRVFISIHHNGGYPEPFPVAGTEVFVQLGDPESSRLGGIIFEEIQASFADIEADWMGNVESFGVAWRQNDEGTDLYGVLRRTPDLVSVLTEAMFISTAAEADLLAVPEILEKEAVALADALDRWFVTDDPGSGHIEGVVFQGDLGNGGGTEGCVDPPL